MLALCSVMWTCRSIADCGANPEDVHALQWASSLSGLERQEQRQLQHVQLLRWVSGMHHDGLRKFFDRRAIDKIGLPNAQWRFS